MIGMHEQENLLHQNHRQRGRVGNYSGLRSKEEDPGASSIADRATNHRGSSLKVRAGQFSAHQVSVPRSKSLR